MSGPPGADLHGEILSLNVGEPAALAWNGGEVVSSMRKTPCEGPLVVHLTGIEGDRFANPTLHGTPDRVLYALGTRSLRAYLDALGLDRYEPGTLGENVTLSELDEERIGVGDVFRFGEVLAMATSPRFPCVKLNYRLGHAEAERQLRRSPASGVYFRILEPGRIHRHSPVYRVEAARVRFPISMFYRKAMNDDHVTRRELQDARAIPGFPGKWLDKWSAALAEP